MNTPALKPGTTVWRIHHSPAGKQPGCVRCQYLRALPGGEVAVRASTFSRNEQTIRAADVFADREACRAEIIRRNEAKETTL